MQPPFEQDPEQSGPDAAGMGGPAAGPPALWYSEIEFAVFFSNNQHIIYNSFMINILHARDTARSQMHARCPSGEQQGFGRDLRRQFGRHSKTRMISSRHVGHTRRVQRSCYRLHGLDVTLDFAKTALAHPGRQIRTPSR